MIPLKCGTNTRIIIIPRFYKKIFRNVQSKGQLKLKRNGRSFLYKYHMGIIVQMCAHIIILNYLDKDGEDSREWDMCRHGNEGTSRIRIRDKDEGIYGMEMEWGSAMEGRSGVELWIFGGVRNCSFDFRLKRSWK